VSYYRGGDKPYLLSGADDQLVKVWDYQTKTCISTLEGHANNVSAVSFHPSLPIILSGSEDGSLRIWHVNTYKLENTLNYGMERVWAISTLKGSNKVAVGYDEGTVSLKLGHEEPVASMHQAKIVWAQNNEMVFANLKQSNVEYADGERVAVSTKEMGTCEVFPQSVSHSPNGRLLVACGDGEYIIYTALALKNHSFGTALEFVWAHDQGGGYAIRESSSKIKVFKASKDKAFVEHKAFRPSFSAEGIFGGALLSVRSADFIEFYDWNECRVIRRIDVCPKKVFWAESGEVVVLACESSYYVLRYNRDLVKKIFDKGIEIPEIENAFDLEQEIQEKVRSGCFVGECFIYTNTAGRLNYYVGGEIMTLAHLTKTMYLLGYVTNANRLFLMDKQKNIHTYQLLVSVLAYQTAIVRQDFKTAESHLDDIPVEQHNKIARFLESYGLKDMALNVTNDPEHKFELAMSCKQLEMARDILLESESEQKWKQLGDAALNQDFNLKLAEECFIRSKDLGGLLLLYTSLCDEKRIAFLAKFAREQGRNNVAFICLFLLNRIEDCITLLCETDRIPEAAFLARTYAPSRISGVLQLWKENLKQVSSKAAEALADPKEYEELFPDLEAAVKIESWLKS
jgi:coatomer subunit beta'